jgi:hypothetical protein
VESLCHQSWQNPCDAVTGTTLRRQAEKVDSILTINIDFYAFAQENIHGIRQFCMSQVEVTETESELKERFSNSVQIPGTTESHFYIALNSNTFRVFSSRPTRFKYVLLGTCPRAVYRTYLHYIQ